MSKVDAQRALREARYEAYRKTTESRAASAPAPARKAAEVVTKAAPPPEPVAEPVAGPVAGPTDQEVEEVEAAEAQPALCGHRGGSGKPCTRPAGHPEKSHRYK